MAIENQKIMEKMDRELFSELIEPPVHLHLVNVQPPLINALDPHFYLQLNCELIWLWRKIPEKELFGALQANICKHCFVLKHSCAPRLGKVIMQHLRRMRKAEAKLNGCERKRLREQKWVTLVGHPEEVMSPVNFIADYESRIANLEEEQIRLKEELDAQAGKLYDAMAEIQLLREETKAANRGKEFSQVGQRQQRRQLGRLK